MTKSNTKKRNYLLEKSGKKVILLGNEAVVRGALESGVQLVSTFPGTPASEIGNSFYALQKLGISPCYFEFSVNEKVALETGIGASFCGLKTLVAMKNFGLNVCQESLLPFMYTGSKGPTVIVVADDPSCHSSAQSEENSRGIARLGHIPTLEPSDPQECLDFVKIGFQISQKFKIPVMIRLTTRVAHQRAPVVLNKIPQHLKKIGKFIKNPKKFITMPPRVLEMKEELLEKIDVIEKYSDKSKINKIRKVNLNLSSQKLQKSGIICSGVSYLYVLKAMKDLGVSLPVLKLGFFYPLPEEKIKRFISNKNKVLIVEELEPYIENEVTRLSKNICPKIKIFGKNLLPITGELRPEMVTLSVAKLINKNFELVQVPNSNIPKRHPLPCPGCPYWFTFSAIKKAVDPEKVIFGGDIGCYMLAGTPSIGLQDYLSCMGSSIGIAHGIKKSTNQKLITFIGDTTFFHAGIPALINTVVNNSNPLIIIMDNGTTAMTGHQPGPGRIIKIENIVKACGVKNLEIIDPIHQEKLVQIIKDFLKKKEVSVIIARRPCIFLPNK